MRHTRFGSHGVLGSARRFTFDVWGDAVNKASFMETHCLPGRINISKTVAGHVKPFFDLQARGAIEAKHERTQRAAVAEGEVSPPKAADFAVRRVRSRPQTTIAIPVKCNAIQCSLAP